MGYRQIQQDFVTIIIVTYNRESMIRRALKSIAGQTVRGFQILVIDDGSTDQTGEIVRKFEDQSGLQIRYIYKENGGVHAARNTGIRNCKTQFFYMLDSDDEMLPGTIEYLYDTWSRLSGTDRDKYRLGIAGLVRNMSTGKICGGGITEL